MSRGTQQPQLHRQVSPGSSGDSVQAHCQGPTSWRPLWWPCFCLLSSSDLLRNAGKGGLASSPSQACVLKALPIVRCLHTVSFISHIHSPKSRNQSSRPGGLAKDTAQQRRQEPKGHCSCRLSPWVVSIPGEIFRKHVPSSFSIVSAGSGLNWNSLSCGLRTRDDLSELHVEQTAVTWHSCAFRHLVLC